MNIPEINVSPIRAVILNVTSMDVARRFYEEALGMQCLGEVREVDPALRELWGLGDGRVNIACMGLPLDPNARVELLAWEGCAGQPLRNQSRVFDYGILTLNLRTSDIHKALVHLEAHGATVVAPPVKYPYQENIFLYEAMAIGPNQERYTLLQIGEAEPVKGHVIGDAVATVGTVVPDSAVAKLFYADVLGLNPAYEMDEQGDIFAPLLGVKTDFRMQMALYTAGDCWTGKLETIKFTSEVDEYSPSLMKPDWQRTGYIMLSLHAGDATRLAGKLKKNEFPIAGASGTIDRHFVGTCHTFITTAPGGVPLEVCTEPGGES